MAFLFLPGQTRFRGKGGQGNARQSIAQPAKAHAFLFQPQPGLVAIEAEVVIHGRLVGRETRQVVACRVGFLAPVHTVGEQRLSVHEEGRRAREVGAQLVEDGEAVGVEVAPIEQLASVQPIGARQCVPAVAGAEDHDGSGHRRKGQEVGLVLGDEDASDGQVKRRKTSGVEREVG